MSSAPSVVHAVPAGADALAALGDAIAAAKDHDALAPVTVVVPSNYSGLSARRALARRGGLLNVRFMVADRLAELAAAGRLPGKAGPLTPAFRTEAIRAALIADPGRFAGAAGHASTVASLERTFAELRHAGEAELAGIAATSPRAAHLVRLFRAYRQRTGPYYDIEDLYAAATTVITGPGDVLRDIGHVILYLPGEQTPARVELWRAIHAEGHLSVIAGFVGDDQVDSRTQELLRSLAGSDTPVSAPPTPAPDVHVLAAADADEEVACVVRMIGAELDRTDADAPRLHRIAVLYPSSDPYAAICTERFGAAGIPINGPANRTLARSLAGRAILALLSLPANEFSRHAVMDLLSLPIRLPGASSDPASRWDWLSREAGVTRGIETWRIRLEAHAARLRQRAAEARKEEWERLADRFDADAALCEELLKCVQSLATESDVSHTGWRAFSAHAVGLLDRYLPESAVRDDAEADARRAVRDALEQLGGLDALGGGCTPDAFLRAVEQQLRAGWGRAGAFDEGVFVASLGAARGTDFDLVFVLGMVEGAVPRAPREDPLLPDHERSAAPSLSARADAQTLRDRDDFLSACALAPRCVLGYPAADLRRQRKNLPSRWLLDACSRLAGRRIFTADFARLLEQPGDSTWITPVPSFQSGLAGRLPPASVVEHDLRSLLASADPDRHPLVAVSPSLQRGFVALRSRKSPAFTEWDGNVGPCEFADVRSGKPTSPTRLESWATCGFRYYLAHVLRVQPTREPEDELRMNPLEKGSLIHEVLEDFFKKHGPGKPPAEPWSREEREALQTLAEAGFARAAGAGATGRPLVWRIEQAQILRDLDALLTLDEARRRTLGATFEAAEFAFGDAERPFVDVPVEGGTLRFRGKIDRIDRSADASLVIYDYKTGSDFGFKKLDEDPLGRGKRLQLPVYAVAARDHYGANAVRAAYWFLGEGVADNPRELPLGHDPAALLRPVLNVVAEGIGGGVFPLHPGEPTNNGFENCRYCDYRRLCPGDRGQAWRRKLEDSALQSYVNLVSGAAGFAEPGNGGGEG